LANVNWIWVSVINGINEYIDSNRSFSSVISFQ